MCNGPLQLPRRRARGRTAKELDLKDVLLTGGMLDVMGSFRGNCLHVETANATASDVSTPCTPGPGTTDYCGGRSVSPNPNQEHRRAQEPRLACALRTPCAQCSSVSRRSLSHPQESGVFALAVVTLRWVKQCAQCVQQQWKVEVGGRLRGATSLPAHYAQRAAVGTSKPQASEYVSPGVVWVLVLGAGWRMQQQCALNMVHGMMINNMKFASRFQFPVSRFECQCRQPAGVAVAVTHHASGIARRLLNDSATALARMGTPTGE
jgi:hypothetical protein